jgi:hypothetical protein
MAVLSQVDAREVARSFAGLARAEPAALRLWFSIHRGVVKLWLLTEPIEAETERGLYALMQAIYERFPDADIRLHLVNPRLFDAPDPVRLIPSDAEEAPFRSQ